MRTLIALLFAASVGSAPALAQDPPTLDLSKQLDLGGLDLSSMDLGALLDGLDVGQSGPEERYATAAVDLARWPGSDVISTALKAGDKVEIVVDDGDLVRVRRGAEFGWVKASALSDTAPEAEAPPAEAPPADAP